MCLQRFQLLGEIEDGEKVNMTKNESANLSVLFVN